MSLTVMLIGLAIEDDTKKPKRGFKWVRKNITPTTAHIRDDTLTAGRSAEECLWESQAENLSAAAKTSYCCLVQRFAAALASTFAGAAFAPF